ncbi:PAS domain S-box protein [bacterium]|nr:PAS domain S-box protein [bacterium]
MGKYGEQNNSIMLNEETNISTDPLIVFARRYEAFFNSTTDGIAVFALSGEILDANKKILKLTEYTYDGIVSKKIKSIFTGSSLNKIQKKIGQLTESNTLDYPVELTLISRSGREYIVEANLNLLKDQYGYAETVLMLLRDITRRKNAENELLERAEELQRVFDAVPTILVVLDEHKRIRRINSTGTEVSGFPEKFALGKRIGEVLQCSKHFKSKRGCGIGPLCRRCLINESINRALKAGERVIGIEESIVKETSLSSSSYYRINVIPLESNNKRWAVLSLEDITKRKNAEIEAIRLNDSITRANIELKESLEKLSRSQSQLVESQKLEQIGLLASGLAHNLKTPLGGIKGYAQLMALDNGETHEIKMILEEVDVMESIIDNLMVKSRHDHDTKEERINLNELINIELKFLESNMFFKHQVKKTIELDTSLPAIFGIYTHFSQILMNVIGNSLDAMHDSDERKLFVKTRHDDENIYIEVSDTGCGIPDEIKGDIIKPFFTTKPSPTEAEEDEPFGTGLGLSSVNYFVHQYGGSISIDSRLGEGTKVTIQFPFHKDLSLRETPRILIVDDLSSLVDILVQVCQSMGLEAYGVSTGEEAIELYKKIEPDIVVSDLCIPGMSGPQLVKEIRTLNSKQRVIYVTGYYDNPDYKTWLSHEMQMPSINAVLKKPFPLEYFKDIVQRMITCA